MVFIDTDLTICFLSNRNTPRNNQVKKIMEQLFQENSIIKLTISVFNEINVGKCQGF